MKKIKKKTIILCSVLFIVSLLAAGVVLQVKANGIIKVNVTVKFIESKDSESAESYTKEFTITNFTDNGNGFYSGTIDLANGNITYEKETGDTRYVIAWYNSAREYINDSTYSFEDEALTYSDDKGVYEGLVIYAEYSKILKINLLNNKYYYSGYTLNNEIVSEYYRQSAAGESSTMISLPSNLEDLTEEFIFDGYEFIGWGKTESGDPNIIKSGSDIIEYPINNASKEVSYYAYWQDQRHSPDVPITGAGEYYLEPGTAYFLGSGNWTVNGGSTKYTGGITFYVNSAGYYTFSN